MKKDGLQAAYDGAIDRPLYRHRDRRNRRDPRNFASARHFAAWLGPTPKEHSTGGKEKLGAISKRGDSYIRRLLIHGAQATVARVRSGQMKSAWLSGLLSRRHFNAATVALANKTARVAWAVMSTEQAYRRTA
ncbi:MAG TPA: transposase [Roseiarcus sp.]